MILVSCNGVKKYYGSELVLHETSFEVQEGERIAIVGPNGCGKSTILKIICKIEECEEGNVAIKKDAVVGYLEQNPQYDPEFCVQDVLNLAFHEVFECKKQLSELEEKLALMEGDSEDVLRKYSSCQERYEHLGGYELEERYSRVYGGLQINDDLLKRPFQMLSGGEKTLICLAKVLLINPDILILDEPTNHLDMNMMDWLEKYLLSYKGSVLFVSHDRYFLGRITTKVVDLEGGTAMCYPYSYTRYVEEKKKLREQQEASYKEQQKQIHKMEQAIKRMRQWAIQADNEAMFVRARSMQKRLDRMDKVEKPKNISYQAKLDFVDSERSGKDVLTIENLSKSFGQKQIFRDAFMCEYYQEHVAIIGPNGCGKTTLLKMLLGEESIDAGVIKVGASVNIAYLPQNVSFEHEEYTVIETFRDGMDMSEGKARELLARYLFKGETVFKKVKGLSGGERSRLKFAMLLQNQINFLILDEPTNHLDIPSRERLEEVLLGFEGTILMISHDRYFINRLASRVIEIEDGNFLSYAGGYDEFMAEKEKVQSILNEKLMANNKNKTETRKKEQARANGNELSRSKENRQSVANRISGSTLAYKLKEAETQIQMLEDKKKSILVEMEQAAKDYIRLSELEQERMSIEAELDLVLEDWMELSNA